MIQIKMSIPKTIKFFSFFYKNSDRVLRYIKMFKSNRSSKKNIRPFLKAEAEEFLSYHKFTNHRYLQFFHKTSMKWYRSFGYLLVENATPTVLFCYWLFCLSCVVSARHFLPLANMQKKEFTGLSKSFREWSCNIFTAFSEGNVFHIEVLKSCFLFSSLKNRDSLFLSVFIKL